MAPVLKLRPKELPRNQGQGCLKLALQGGYNVRYLHILLEAGPPVGPLGVGTPNHLHQQRPEVGFGVLNSHTLN